MPEGGVPRDEAGVGGARAPNPDELPGDATSEHGGDPQHWYHAGSSELGL